MRENIKFALKVTAAHVATYLVCGLIFARLFDYETLFAMGDVRCFMRDAYGTSSVIGPFVQVLRGAIIGCILLILKDTMLNKKLGWLYLWILFARLGIVCTPAAAPVSIEGIVYSRLPLEFHLKTAPELFVQTLLFSLLVARNFRLDLPEKIAVPVIVTAVSAVGFSVGGIILALVLKADIMAGVGDPGAFAVMFAALAVVFGVTVAYASPKKCLPAPVYYVVCYLSLAVAPMAYNYLTGSPLRSPLSLVFSGLPVVGDWRVFLREKQTLPHGTARRLKTLGISVQIP